MHFWPAKLNKHYTNKRKSPETDITTRTALSVGGFGRFWRSLVAVCRTTVWQHCFTMPRPVPFLQAVQQPRVPRPQV